MMKGKVINIVLVVAVVALLAVFAFSVRVRPTADSVAVLSTTGMTCERCGSAIERALRTEKGVAAVEADVAGGRVIVAYDSKATGPAAISSTVDCLGYQNSVADCLSAEQYRKLSGREPGINAPTAGCGGCCSIRN